MNRARTVTAGLLLVIAALTIIVAAGIGQGSPPPALPISDAAKAREIRAVDHGSPTVEDGERLFASHGCDDCHTMAAGGYTGRLGPRLDVRSQGNPVSEIEGKITHPPDDDEGYEAGLMPENFGQRLSAHDVHALAVYVHASASAAAGRGRHRRRHRRHRRPSSVS